MHRVSCLKRTPQLMRKDLIKLSTTEMDPRSTGLYVSFFIFLSTTAGDVPMEVLDYIQYRFENLYGAHLYFCYLTDAASAFRRLIQGSPRYNIRYLDNNHEAEELLINYIQPQKIGVFLDLSCDRAQFLLDWSSGLFNASYSWILWSSGEVGTSLLKNSRLNADSEVRILEPGLMVYDVFRLHTSLEILKTHIGEWNGSWNGTQEPSNRTDFNGFVFNASLMMIDIKFNESNLIEPLLDKAYESGKDMVRRYGLAVFIHLAEMYNFSYRYVTTDAWGDPLPNGTVTGMVGQVMRGEAEFGLAPAKYIIPRYEIIDYVTSLSIVKVCFTFLQPKLFGSAKALVLPLDDVVWYCLAGIGVLSAAAFRVLSRHDNTSNSNDNWGGSVLLVVGAISQQGIPDSTERTSTRIVYIFLLMVCFFTAVYYNTAILNSLLLPAPNAIQNIEQLLKSDTKLGMLDIPYLHHEMKQNDTLTNRVREKINKAKPKKIYYSAADGVFQIKKGKFALYTEDEAIYTEILRQMTDAEVCSVSEVVKYNPFHVGAVAQKNSPYKELFNRAFSLMRERGVLHRQLQHWLEKKPECQWRQDALTLGMEPLALAYAVFIFGLLGSLLILGMEILFDRKRIIMRRKFK